MDQNMQEQEEEEEPEIRGYTLWEFCNKAGTLSNLPDKSEFVRFALTGIESDGRQAAIDVLQNAAGFDDPLYVSRDYDSLLGLSPEIEVDDTLMMYPIAKRHDTLTHTVHLCYDIRHNMVLCHFHASSL